jgi:hypothetical protein
MKLRRDAKTLKAKSLASLRRGVTAFNSYEEDGRVTTVLLHLQHASEMLLKAALFQKKLRVFDKNTDKAIGFQKCINLARNHCGVTDEEAGVLRAICSLRDATQHWMVFVSEAFLYLHTRALVTVLDDLLKRVFDDDLASHLPLRVLPISTTPGGDIDLLIDREYTQIAELLAPGRRARDEARGRIRTLLAMESHVVDEVEVSERDINRVERAVKAGKPITEVFPRLTSLGTRTEGEGLQVKVHFTKKGGAPVRFVSGDDPEEAGAVREIDLRRRFHMGANDLANKLGLTPPRSAALRAHVRIDEDPQSCHVIEIGKSKFPRYSDNAMRKMRNALVEVDMDEVWEAYRARTGFGGRRAAGGAPH